MHNVLVGTITYVIAPHQEGRENLELITGLACRAAYSTP